MRRAVVLAAIVLVGIQTLACGLAGGRADEPTAAVLGAPTAGPSDAASTPTARPIEAGEDKPETAFRAADAAEMVRIPAGAFLMGDDASPFPPEKPAHLVQLDDYWIDRLEVTNGQYGRCLDEGACREPRAWQDANFNAEDQPAIVDWEGANAYCRWAGVRLPTEAEWEKAARGTDGRTWPWGDEFRENAANLSGDADGYGFTAPVGSFPGDASPYGLLDVAGNAAEWVADWFAVDAYARSPAANPTGPPSGEQKVHRAPIANAGGGPEKCRCTSRYGVHPSWTYGFRCASSENPAD